MTYFGLKLHKIIIILSGQKTIEVWNIYAPQGIINNLDKIYDDIVCEKEKILE